MSLINDKLIDSYFVIRVFNEDYSFDNYNDNVYSTSEYDIQASREIGKAIKAESHIRSTNKKHFLNIYEDYLSAYEGYTACVKEVFVYSDGTMAEIMICGGIFDMNDVNIVWDYLIGTRKDLSDAGELNAVMNPDNINDDGFPKNENHICQPKICAPKGFILIASDGYSIEHTRYSTKKEAYKHMSKAYSELNRNEPDDEWSEQSYITEDSAILYDQGENVYLWSVIKADSSSS